MTGSRSQVAGSKGAEERGVILSGVERIIV